MKSARRLKLTPGRKSALAKLKKRAGLASVAATIPPRNPDQVPPLAFVQQRMWFFDQMVQDSAVYNIPAALRLTGPLDPSAFRDALQAVVDRNEILRACVGIEDGAPFLDIASKLEIALPTVSSESVERARAQIRELVRQAFVLKERPLFRTQLLRLSEHDHIFVFVIHHILAEAWSLAILFDEIALAYEAFRRGHAPEFPENAVAYGDFALWEHAQLAEIRQRELPYWESILSPPPKPILLTGDRPRPAIQTYRGGWEEIQLPLSLHRALTDLATEHGVSLFMLLLAAYQVLLHRYTNEVDITVGSPIATRSEPGLERSIGLFINTLVLRSDLSGDPSFTGLLAHVRERCLGAFDHKRLPFEAIVQSIPVERSLSFNQLMQVMFVLQNAPSMRESIGDLHASTIDVHSQTTKSDLSLIATETAHGIRLAAEYASDLFDAETVRRMLTGYQTLLESVLENPTAPISRLEVIHAEERKRIVEEFSPGPVPVGEAPIVPLAIAERSRAHPSRVAVVAPDGTVHYGELDGMANALARELIEDGLQPGEVVGVLLPPSLHMVVAPLAIMKAGGAYLPIDSEYPDTRIRYLLKDSGAKRLLTLRTLAKRCSDHRPLYLDDARHASSEAPASCPNARDPAYVIYTSGSTGKPKGVVLSHGALGNLCRWHNRAFAIRERDVATRYAGFGFDASVWETWPYLVQGARLHVVPAELRFDLDGLNRYFESHGVTVAFLPTQVAEAFAEGTDNASLRILLTGGDKLTRYHPRRYTMVNNYGPTETTVVATSTPVVASASNLPIGRPIDGSQVHILDHHRQLCPIGIPGELYIGGAGVAEGYLGRPELTEERFVWHEGQRAYRTGDRGRWRRDGQVEILGRIDRQVKIRGVRIELGEVETALSAHPGVEAAATRVFDRESGDKTLVGYVVGNVVVEDLRTSLAKELPDALIPHTIVQIPSMPLTKHGKIDYESLKAPEAKPIEAGIRESGVVPARTPVEDTVVRAFAEVLNIPPPSVHANFFELGGNSMDAIRIILRINEAGLALSPRQFFIHKTIAGLAATITSRGFDDGNSPCLVNLRDGQGPPLFLFHSTPGDVLGYGGLVHYLPGDYPCVGVQSLGLSDLKKAHRSIEDMALHYARTILERFPEGPYFVGGWCFGGTTAHEVAYQLDRLGGRVGSLILLEAHPRMRDFLRLRERANRARRLALAGPNLWVRFVANRMRQRIHPGPDPLDVFALDVHAGPFAHRREVYEQNYRALVRHRSKYFEGRGFLLRGPTQPHDVHAYDDYGWSRHVRDINVRVLSGEHEALLHEPHVRPLAEAAHQAIV